MVCFLYLVKNDLKFLPLMFSGLSLNSLFCFLHLFAARMRTFLQKAGKKTATRDEARVQSEESGKNARGKKEEALGGEREKLSFLYFLCPSFSLSLCENP